ncbi:CapA family protein [Paenibacillus etheri]|uniref:CapA family protein n=1 Tax=Paenibacillus etheri TaxID=1306852 RepID=UPI000B2E9A8C|nr:CapA family protein [Paenibacillus etheri]
MRILDRNGLDHTGTSSSLEESRKSLIKNVKGITIGILSYTAGLRQATPALEQSSEIL